MLKNRLAKLAGGAKARNKELLERLARYNLRLASPFDIRLELGLTDDDMLFLSALGHQAGAWRKAAALFGIYGRKARLFELGLVFISGKGEISLSDAGRFLLVLADSQSVTGQV